jgi:hypothetical protein
MPNSDNRPIFQSPVIQLKRIEYTGHACIVQSFEDALDVVTRISLDCYSAQCAPYAIRLEEEDGIREIYEDQGEFTAGSTLASCLKSFEKKYSTVNGANILLVVTRKVSGFFVGDMIQHQKFNAIKNCGMNALKKLNKHVIPRGVELELAENTTGNQDTMAYSMENAVEPAKKSGSSRPTHKPATVSFDPGNFDLPAIPEPRRKDNKRPGPGHFMDR